LARWHVFLPAVNEQIVESDAALDGVLHHLDGLHKKFTLRNINDGLCSRVTIFQMERANYQMVRKNVVDWQANESMKLIRTFGFAELTWHSEMQKKNKLFFCISLVYS
jgi:hypothetical protein